MWRIIFQLQLPLHFIYNKAKNLAEEPLHCSTGGDGRVVSDEELGEDLVAHESTVAQVFFLGGPSSQLLTSFVAFVLRTLREEPVVARVKLSNQSVHSTSSVFDQKLRALPPSK
jgi:hypothetical protein